MEGPFQTMTLVTAKIKPVTCESAKIAFEKFDAAAPEHARRRRTFCRLPPVGLIAAHSKQALRAARASSGILTRRAVWILGSCTIAPILRWRHPPRQLRVGKGPPEYYNGHTLEQRHVF